MATKRHHPHAALHFYAGRIRPVSSRLHLSLFCSPLPAPQPRQTLPPPVESFAFFASSSTRCQRQNRSQQPLFPLDGSPVPAPQARLHITPNRKIRLPATIFKFLTSIPPTTCVGSPLKTGPTKCDRSVILPYPPQPTEGMLSRLLRPSAFSPQPGRKAALSLPLGAKIRCFQTF